MVWRIPGIANTVSEAGGGGECSHATSERFFNSYVLVTGGGREKGCSIATSERFFNSYVLVTGEEGEKGCSLATHPTFSFKYSTLTIFWGTKFSTPTPRQDYNFGTL